MVSVQFLRRTALGTAILAFLSGSYGILTLLGAFGPVDCWTGQSQSSSGSVVTTHGCEAGIDYLYGSTAGNAPVLFFWAMVLLGLVVIGLVATWTGHRRVTWATAVVGFAISILGLLSIGWVFIGPALLLLISAAAMTVARREGGRPTPSITDLGTRSE